MRKKGDFSNTANVANMAETIEKGFILQTDQEKLKDCSPMATIQPWSKEKTSPFYEINQEGDVSVYIFCNGEEDIDWILEELEWDAVEEKEGIQLLLRTSRKVISFDFCFGVKEEAYSIIKLALQPYTTVYYLMNRQSNVHYLGYHDIPMEEELKKRILSSVMKSSIKIDNRAF